MKINVSPQTRSLLINSRLLHIKKDVCDKLKSAALEYSIKDDGIYDKLKRLLNDYHINEHTKKVYGVSFNDNLTANQLSTIQDSLWEIVPKEPEPFYPDPIYDSSEYVATSGLFHLERALLAFSKMLPLEQRAKATLADLRKMFKF